MMQGFQWLIEGRLASAPQPGLLSAIDADMAFLRERGIHLVVTLTESPLEPPASAFGLAGLHFPIDDMGVPGPRAAEDLCRRLVASLERDEPVLVHCRAGLGRTGTMLACCLVSLGRTPEDAIVELRCRNPYYIQTGEQERFVEHYAEHLLSATSPLPRMKLPTPVPEAHAGNGSNGGPPDPAAALRETEERFRQLADHIEEVFWLCSADRSRLFYISPSFERIWGRSCESVYADPMTFMETIHPDDREWLGREIAVQLDGTFEERYDQEYRIVRPDGAVRWIWTRYFPARGASGEIERLAGISTDVTDRKQAEAKLRRLNDTLEQRVAERTEELRAANLELRREIEDRKKAEAALRESEQRHRVLFERNNALLRAIPDMMFRICADGIYLEFIAAADLEPYLPPDQFIGRHMRDVLPEEVAEPCVRIIRQALATGEPQVFEYRLPSPETLLDFEARFVISGPDEVTVIVRDITDRKRTEQRLRASVEEKDALLKEVHHRVKNNLQIISSLLHLQSRRATDGNVKDPLEKTRQRICSMALLHELLYQSSSLSRIQVAKYLSRLTVGLASTCGADDRVRIETDADEDVFLDIEASIPCGLIVTELLTNALKYAFPDGREGTVRVEFRGLADGGGYVLAVDDDGVGLPAGLDPAASETLGLQLVGNLVRQLDGTLELRRSPGTRFEIRFPAE